jgi:hypothetical protein
MYIENKELKYVKAKRTFNNEEIYGYFGGFYQPTKKMKENHVYVGIVFDEKFNRFFDVYPSSIVYINQEFNIYEFIS